MKKVVHIPSLGVLVSGSRELDLDTVHAVDAIDEQDQDENECDLHPVLYLGDDWILGDEAVRLTSVIIVASWALLGTHVKILLFRVKGRGTIRSMNSAISKTSSTKT